MIRRAAIDAGSAIMEHYDPSGFHGTLTLKEDQSPVTAADLAADRVIADFLAAHFPGIPVISEEQIDQIDHDQLAATDHYWLVDPLDGTRAFARGERDFTVNIALIHHDTPLLGVIYAPALEEGFTGIYTRDQKTAQRFRDKGADDDIAVREIPGNGLTVLTSQTGSLSPYTLALMDQIKINKHIKRSSSIKFAEVAAGRADLVVTTRHVSYWDSAAGDAIIRAAGGHVVRFDGTPVTYDRHRKTLDNHGIVACGDLNYFSPVLQDILAHTS